jgi:hypothetical protein
MGRLRIGYTDGEATYDDRVAEAALPGDDGRMRSRIGLPLALIPSEALGIAERRLAEARVARDSINVQLPPSARTWGRARSRGPTDPHGASTMCWTGARDMQAVRVEPSTAEPERHYASLRPSRRPSCRLFPFPRSSWTCRF